MEQTIFLHQLGRMVQLYLSLYWASTDPTETEIASATLFYARSDLPTDYNLTAMLSLNESSLAQRCSPIPNVSMSRAPICSYHPFKQCNTVCINCFESDERGWASTLSTIWGVLMLLHLMNCRWIAVQGAGRFCTNTGEGALECTMQSPISDFLPHNTPTDSEWGHEGIYCTADDNIITRQDPIMVNLVLFIEVCGLFHCSELQNSRAAEWGF